MSAIAPLSRESATPEQRALFDAVQRRFGRELTPVAVTAHNPAILDAMMGFEGGLARARALPERLKHLVNLKVAALLGCPFCIDIGSHLARNGGVTDAALRDLASFRRSPEFTDEERAALAAAETMTMGDGELPDDLWRELREHFDDTQLVELFAVVAWENYRSRFNRAAGLQAAGFCSIAQRVAAENRAGGLSDRAK